MKPIPLTRPILDEAEQQAVAEVLRSGWLAQGRQVALFEAAVCTATGRRFAIAVSSGSAALHLALRAAGLGLGDAVLLPSFTFVATANAVEHVGATPVLVDIDPATFNIDLDSLRERLQDTPDARCLLPVSQFGLRAPMEEIAGLASERGLIVVEDAACSLGATLGGRHVGSDALAACLSFHPRKVITTGEGGMILTDDDRLAERLRRLRNHGTPGPASDIPVSGSILPEYETCGFNFRLSDIHGALGRVQTARLDDLITQRREAAHRYDQLLAETDFLRAPTAPPGAEPVYQSYVCLLEPGTGLMEADRPSSRRDDLERLNARRNRLVAAARDEGLFLQQGTHAVHTLSYYRAKYGYEDFDLPRALLADRLSLALPLYPGIHGEDQIRVVETLQRLYRQL